MVLPAAIRTRELRMVSPSDVQQQGFKDVYSRKLNGLCGFYCSFAVILPACCTAELPALMDRALEA